MVKVVVIDDRQGIADLLVQRLRECPDVELCHPAPQREDGFAGLLSGGYATFFQEYNIDTVVYSPPLRAGKRMTPDLADAEAAFEHCVRVGIKKIVLLSSAAVYGADPRNPGLMPESHAFGRNGKNPIGGQWAKLEELAIAYTRLEESQGCKLTILRPAPTILAGGADYFSRLFKHRFAITLPGHDPSIQLLSPEDLAKAVCCAVTSRESGVYNVAPKSVIPIRAALRLAGSKRIPVPRVLQRLARLVLAPLGPARPIEQLEYIRYSWSISGQKIKNELGFIPKQSSAEALIDFHTAKSGTPALQTSESTQLEFDDFGLDKNYIAAFGRTLFNFLHQYYWRIEVKGFDNVPRAGRAVLVGIHRGLMPWDGAMVLHLLVQRIGRFTRFLIHPALIKFPFLFNFHMKLGGVVACQENADYMLERDELLGIFPEGIHGAFTLYRDAYQLGKFGRNDFVRMALRNRAPIVPFVIVGSAEIFPILGKIEWSWWKRYTQWPFIPITPTFPLLPLPLPSKWHMQFLPPLDIESQYPSAAADDPATVRAIGQEVRDCMEKAMQQMLNRRKSIFFGSIFDSEVG